MAHRILISTLLLWGAIQAVYAENENLVTSERQSKLGLGTNTIAQLAQDLLTRSTTSSQVLSLNLTNLVILLVVKALIFGAGHLGFGGGDHLGRSVDVTKKGPQEIVSEAEVLLMLSYMDGAVTGKYDCLYEAACQNPQQAKEYFTASNILVKGAEMFSVPMDHGKYKDVLKSVDEAMRFGSKGYECRDRYKCERNS